MRQIKNFMKSKSSWRCGNPKECITPMSWKCNNELCWCGGNGWWLDNKIVVIPYNDTDNPSLYWSYQIYMFGMPSQPSSWYDEVEPTIRTWSDYETWDCQRDYNFSQLNLSDEAEEAFYEVWYSVDSCYWILSLLGLYRLDEQTWIEYYETLPQAWTFTSEAMQMFNDLIKNPTQEQIDLTIDWLVSKISMVEPTPIVNIQTTWPTLPNYKYDFSDNYLNAFHYWDNCVRAHTTQDPETVEAWFGPESIYSNPFFDIDNPSEPWETVNCWIWLFESLDAECLEKYCNGCDTFPDDVYNAFNTLYQNPSPENAEATKEALEYQCSQDGEIPCH